VMVFKDERGLPFAEAIRELELKGQGL
jgi:hypothetical protein